MRRLFWTAEVRRALLWLLVVLPIFGTVVFLGAKPEPCPPRSLLVGSSCMVLLR